jgi:hypothetical protein
MGYLVKGLMQRGSAFFITFLMLSQSEKISLMQIENTSEGFATLMKNSLIYSRWYSSAYRYSKTEFGGFYS